MLFLLNVKLARRKVMDRVKQKILRMSMIFRINMMKVKFKRRFARLKPTLQGRLHQMLRYSIIYVEP